MMPSDFAIRCTSFVIHGLSFIIPSSGFVIRPHTASE